MSIQKKAKIQRYIDILNERYNKMLNALEGEESVAIELAAEHSPHPENFLKHNVFINSLDVRLAADDFNNILKEIKKLK